MLELDLTTTQEEQVNIFAEEAFSYNKIHNLFVRVSIREIYRKDIADCLPLKNFLKPASSILDVGTGAGFPGIILAITNPGCSITLAESNKKKTYFLKKIIKKIGLNNTTVIEEHITKQSNIGSFDVVTARAFASTKKIISICDNLLKEDGKYLLLKGKKERIQEELQSIDKKLHKCEIIKLDNKKEERHILQITKEKN